MSPVRTIELKTITPQNDNLAKNLSSNHGGNILSYEKNICAHSVKDSNFIDFSANINPFGLSNKAVKILKNHRLIKFFIENYPDAYPATLINAISGYHNTDKESIFLGAGATDLIFSIMQTMRPNTTLIVEPSFMEYERSAMSVKSSLVYIKTYPVNNFNLLGTSYLNLLKSIEEMGENSLIFIANPSNPAGTVTPLYNIEEILKKSKKRGIFLILDESFMDFCEKFSAKHLIGRYDNLIIIRSLTKFFAMPGQRLGYAIANNKTVKRFTKYIIPWKITEIGTNIAIASLSDKDGITATLQKLEKLKVNFYNKLKTINELTVIPSEANYFLIKIKSNNFTASDLKKYLIETGILIRCCNNYRGLSDQYFRVAVKKQPENKYLIEKLKEFINRQNIMKKV